MPAYRISSSIPGKLIIIFVLSEDCEMFHCRIMIGKIYGTWKFSSNPTAGTRRYSFLQGNCKRHCGFNDNSSISNLFYYNQLVA